MLKTLYVCGIDCNSILKVQFCFCKFLLILVDQSSLKHSEKYRQQSKAHVYRTVKTFLVITILLVKLRQMKCDGDIIRTPFNISSNSSHRNSTE
jgi:hypothetical protein